MPTYDGIGSSITHEIEVVGDVFISNVEGGSLSTQVPFEIFSNVYGMATPPTDSRQVRLRVQPTTQASPDDSYVSDMGIQNTTDNYFFITAPQNTSNVGYQNTFVISKTSNVGIGTTNPEKPLHVVGDSWVTGTLTASNIVGGSPLTLSSDSLVKVEGSGGLSVTGPLNVAGGGTINGTSATYTGQVQAATVSSTGDVLSGGTVSASSNSQTIHIFGKAKIGGTGGAARFGHYDYFDDGVSWALSHGNSGGTYLNRASGKDINFTEANDSAQMIIKTGGNVGIGTDSPTQLLDVRGGNIAISEGFSFVGLRTADDTVAGYITSNNGGWNIGETRGGNKTDIQVGVDDIIFSTGSTPDERMRILSNGNVGIDGKLLLGGSTGALSSEGLTMKGDITIVKKTTQTAGPAIVFYEQDGSSQVGFMGGGSSAYPKDMYLYGRASSNVRIGAGDAERMTILTNGNVGIGQTTPGASLDIYRYASSASSSPAFINMWMKNSHGSAWNVWTMRIKGITNNGSYVRGSLNFCWSGSAETVSTQDPPVIAFDGYASRILVYGTSVHTSDDRVKINEERITNATETIMKLDPQIYDKLRGLNDSNVIARESGLIIQDIWYDAPELRHLISISDDANPPEEKPSKSDNIQEDPDYSTWGSKESFLNYNGLIPYLIKSIQEQQALIENLKARIESLENSS